MIRVAFIRGINVGGRNALPMKSLVSCLESLGMTGVKTHIQSGNAVFRSPRGSARQLARRLQEAISQTHGLRPGVLILSASDLAMTVQNNPFAAPEFDPGCLHVLFLDAAPDAASVQGLEALRSESERYALDGTRLYLYLPDGAARSRLAGRAEQQLGVTGTARNWRTVTKVLEMTRGAE